MFIDLELYRKEVLLPSQPPIRLSVIDIAPDHPQRTMVFLHGFGGYAMQWQYQLRHFGTANRVIAPDLRGHGLSEKPGNGYHMAQIVADLEATLDTLGVAGKFILIGHSFGGAVAAEFAAAHPQQVERLVLIATAGEFRLNPFYRLALQMPLSMLKLATPLAGKYLGAPAHVLQRWYRDNLSKWSGWSLFRGLHTPTLIIRGHMDLVLQRPAFEEVVRAIPKAEEVNLRAAGHLVMLERREAVNRAIKRFIEARPVSWREMGPDQETSARVALVSARPWLNHYDSGVPYTLAIPRLPLQEVLRSAARRFPRHAAILFEGRRLTYRELDRLSNRFANALGRLGVKPGNRVMLFLPNVPQLIIAFFGVLKAGAVVVFTLPTTRAEELMRQVHESGAQVLITLDQFAEVARQVMREANQGLSVEELPAEAGILPTPHIIFSKTADYLSPLKRLLLKINSRQDAGKARPLTPFDAEEHDFKALLAEQSEEQPLVEIGAEVLAVIHYTGGTTADPRGVMLSHRNLVSNALQTRSWIPWAKDGAERFLSVLPFSHSYGLTTALLVPISMGATIILKAKFEVTEVLKTIRRYRPTIFPGVPSMYVAINDFPKVRRYGIHSIKACISGSAPLPLEVQEAFEKLTRGRLVEGYGLTEASPVTHANPLNGLRKLGSIGIPLPSTEARVVDLMRGREEVPPGQIGELAVRGPQVMMGYWQNPTATRQAITPDGWLLTGDIAQMDEEGYFRIIARKAEMWYAGKPGKPAFPRDVEEVLFEVPQVKEAAVVAIAGQPIAFVIARSEQPTAESLIAYCRRRLPPELVPRMVIFLNDFPRTFIGKVLRRELARRFEESRRITEPRV